MLHVILKIVHSTIVKYYPYEVIIYAHSLTILIVVNELNLLMKDVEIGVVLLVMFVG